MDRTLSGAFWVGLYLLLVLVPVFLMLVPPTPSGRPFWLEFSIALGFVGLTQLAVQFVLIARFRRVTEPYGIDAILQVHRQIALLAVGAVIAHPLIIVIDNPSRLKLLNIFAGNWASRCGWFSILSLLAILTSSLWRKPLRLRYEWWRLAHLLLGVSAIVFAQLHASLAGLYKNTAWKHAIWIAIAAVMVGLVLFLRVIRPAWQRGYKWRVAGVEEKPGNTFKLVLEAVGHPGIKFLPGQFAWLKLARSPFTLEEHPFSFSSSAEQNDRVEFGIKALGDFSGHLADVPVGTRAFLDGPHGAFSIDRYPATGYVFIAGGVGITPMMSFLHTMADRKDPRPVQLFYSSKNEDDISFREELEALAQKVNVEVVHVLEKPGDSWQGEKGFVDRALLERHLPKDRFPRVYFICGPPPMMAAIETALGELGVPKAAIQSENFTLV